MHSPTIRPATTQDLPQLLAIYNHYVVHTPITFDIEPMTLEQRARWFDQFSLSGRHRLFVAERAGRIDAYAGTHAFRTKQAYDTSVETTVYCTADAQGQGLGRALYDVLFKALQGEDIHVFIAGITLPNAASVRLHERMGFTLSGTMHAVGRKFDKYWDVGWYEKVLTG